MTSEAFESGLPPASDRILTTCFLAALLHAIVILGVTFSSPDDHGDGDEARGLEVVLVDDQAPSVARNPTARHLAQRSQRGSGNTLAAERALIPKSAPLAAARQVEANGNGIAAEKGGLDTGDEPLLGTSGPSPQILYFGASTQPDSAPKPQLLLESIPTVGVNPNDEGVELRMRGETKHELWVTADTRESDMAVYLDRWRRQVERVGTLNFPSAARRQKNSGTPVIEVTIGADGRLTQAVIRQSSGHRELDDAAIRILRLAAPFDRFSPEMNATHDEIRIAYEWQFLDGASAGSSVVSSVPGAP
jgi:protein TonB